MSNVPIIGTCRLCGEVRRLTFEHAPPKAVGNRGATIIYGADDWMRRDQLPVLGTGRPRGMGDYIFCEPCNNLAGRKYISGGFLPFVDQGRKMLKQYMPLGAAVRSPTPEVHKVQFSKIYPLRIVKQIACMGLFLCGTDWAMEQEELRAFVRDPKSQGLPGRYRMYITLYRGPLIRGHGLDYRLDLEAGAVYAACELAWPPFAYLMTVDSPPGFQPWGDITGWGDYRFDQSCDITCDLRVGFGFHPLFVGDYRTGMEIYLDGVANAKDALAA